MTEPSGRFTTPPRFLADENLEKAIVDGFRRKRPGATFLTPEEAGIRGLSDPEALKRAQALDLTLVSHDRRTMYGHFADFLLRLSPGEHCPGVMLVSQERFGLGQIIGFLVEIYDLSGHAEWRDRIVSLPL